ncbi:MAG TPA: Rieske (2Fe-2S) protein [Aeromonadales bacterium]|nr:Rieske (2Fe-2S) protein [Aeromonadales bacterium]
MKKICQLSEIEDGQAHAYPHPEKENRSVIVARMGNEAFAFLNMCPHMGVELQFQENKFMSFDGSQIQCAMHGALFDIPSGYCNWGPCSGQSLIPISIIVEGDMVYFNAETANPL